MKLLVTSLLLALAASGLGSAVPRAEDIMEITFFSYTRSNPDTYEQIWVGNLSNSAIDVSKPFKFIVHGFTDSASGQWVIDAKDAFLRVEDCNVISVDWSDFNFNYYFNVDRTGMYLAQLYDYLASLGASPASFYCAGHSLGGHVCGWSGKSITAGTLGRITGLDPSEAEFPVEDPSVRLADTDAAMVEVIHTCGGRTGYLAPIGKIDFFPNGGTPSQPGHTRVRELFVESIESAGFVSRFCDSWENFQAGICSGNPSIVMGAMMDLDSAPGTYFLATHDRSPYALSPPNLN